MIHQLIFAHPRPGMSETDFQNYWINVHAVKYASKIPQIKRYLIDSRIRFGVEPEDPLFSGVGEIWLADEAEQIASLQSKEYLEGARLDEPNWAAFWRTVVLDTKAHILMEVKPPQRDSKMVKLLMMVKRKAGIPLVKFQHRMLKDHAANVMKLPCLQRYLQCHVRDSFYALGESLFDCVSQLWFEDLKSLEKALNSREYQELILPEFENLFETKYIHQMVTTETWIIGPEFR